MTDVATETSEAILAANLRQLVRLRWFVVGGCTLLLLTAARDFGLVTNASAGWASLATYALTNLAMLWWIRAGRHVGEWFFAANLGLDLLLIGAFLAATGGAANPFTLLFLLPVVVAAATLTSRPIWAVTLFAWIAYSWLLVQFPGAAQPHQAPDGIFDRHVLGMWLGLIFVASLVAYFAAWMGQALRQRERDLAIARERQLRDERVLALGSLAASAAHELGTPLSTMAVLSGELARDARPDQGARIDLLRNQIDRCKQVLSGLSQHGDQLRAEGGRGMSAAELLQLLSTQSLEMRPATPVQWSWQGPDRSILVDQSLIHALAVFINNAADASPEIVLLSGWSEHGDLMIEIKDHGPGMARDMAERFGQEPMTSKAAQGGLGIGAMLAHAVIERLDGRVRIANLGDDENRTGTCVQIRLPLDTLGITPPSRSPRGQQPEHTN